MEGQKNIWRSLGELWALRSGKPLGQGEEFPEGYFPEPSEGISRREFLKLGGVSLALGGIGLAGCRKAEGYLVPYTSSPEWIVPGNPVRYATCFPHRSGAVPLWAITYEGRPTHLEPNELWAQGKGGLSPQIQASIYDLYDPDRSRTFRKEGRPVLRQEFVRRLREIVAGLGTGKGVGILLEPSTSPTQARLCRELSSRYPELFLAAYDPVSNASRYAACELFYGARYSPRFLWGEADVLLAVECDFCNASQEGPQAVGAFTERRRVRDARDSMNRLYVVESRFTTTGATADHRLALRASDQPFFLVELIQELAAQGVDSLKALSLVLPRGRGWSERQKRWIAALAQDLRKASHPLVAPGRTLPLECQLLAIAINEALQPSSAVQWIPPLEPKLARLEDLAQAMEQGRLRTLLILGPNPAYTAPRGLEWSRLQAKIPETIHFGTHYDETAEGTQWHAPLAHYLESWGDGFAADGTYVTQQPVILPFYGAISSLEILSALLGDPQALEEPPPPNPTLESMPTLPGQPSLLPEPTGLRLVRETFAQAAGLKGWELAKAWRKCLHDGFWAGSAPAPVSPRANWGALADYLSKHFPKPLPEEAWELTLYPCPKIDDGRYANNGWLQELPEPVTKLTWDNALLLSPKSAERLGIRQDGPDFNEVELLEVQAEGRKLTAAAFVVAGHPDGSFALALGYGRRAGGRIAKECGFDGYEISGQDPWTPKLCQVRVTGERYRIAQTQHHWRMEGRALVREGTLALFRREPGFATKLGEEAPEVSLYPHPFAPPEPEGPPYRGEMSQGPHQWGMVIDLGACVGCSACVVACQSENNVPIVGKDQVIRYRAMHWLRVDRYYVGDPEDPGMAFQPVLCQQCEMAPCEPVCPVNATVHSEDGLNVMVYNRCIGTRACGNNCPYKVRRFNFFDYNKRDVIGRWHFGPFTLSNLYLGPFGALGTRDPLPMQKNPRVTVRMRGVMEKCTFCIQRIEGAKIAALARARDSAKVQVPTDSFQTACQSACPAGAITFGNLADSQSEVRRWWSHPRGYRLLGELNTRPRVRYLARIRNPNPELEGEKGLQIEEQG